MWSIVILSGFLFEYAFPGSQVQLASDLGRFNYVVDRMNSTWRPRDAFACLNVRLVLTNAAAAAGNRSRDPLLSGKT